MKQLRLIPLLAFAVLVAASLASQPVVRAQERIPTDDEVNEVAKDLYCPVCPNTPLDVCETQACKDWRDEIRSQLAAGWSEEEIMATFAQRYGERVLAEPERKGFSYLIWILPYVAVLFGLVIVLLALRSWRAGRAQDLGAAGGDALARDHDVAPEARARIERELQELL